MKGGIAAMLAAVVRYPNISEGLGIIDSAWFCLTSSLSYCPTLRCNREIV
jgi:hypothetical protein